MGPFSLCRYGMLCGKRGKTFLVLFAGPNDSIWENDSKFVELLRTILVSSCGLEKKFKKSHYNSRVSLHEAPTNDNARIRTRFAGVKVKWLLASRKESCERLFFLTRVALIVEDSAREHNRSLEAPGHFLQSGFHLKHR